VTEKKTDYRSSGVVKIGEWEPIESDYIGDDPLTEGVKASRLRREKTKKTSESAWKEALRKALGGG